MIAGPLTEPLKKEAFLWLSVAEASFEDLKKAITSAPFLRLPYFEQTFIGDTFNWRPMRQMEWVRSFFIRSDFALI